MNEREAWRRYRIEQAILLKREWRIKRLQREIDEIESQIHVAWARELATTRPGQKVLHAFRGCTQFGWEIACGTDGRLKTAARRIGWEKFQQIIALAREMETTPRDEWPPYWSM